MPGITNQDSVTIPTGGSCMRRFFPAAYIAVLGFLVLLVLLVLAVSGTLLIALVFYSLGFVAGLTPILLVLFIIANIIVVKVVYYAC